MIKRINQMIQISVNVINQYHNENEQNKANLITKIVKFRLIIPNANPMINHMEINELNFKT